MAESIIHYDHELPEVPGRCPWKRPDSFLVKDPTSPNGWREDTSGRRPSQLLLIPKLRTAVDQWRNDGYPEASEVTRRLFEYWFEEDHEVAGFPIPFRYHFCQREAIETLAYVVEIVRNQDAKALVNTYADVFEKDLLSKRFTRHASNPGRRKTRSRPCWVLSRHRTFLHTSAPCWSASKAYPT